MVTTEEDGFEEFVTRVEPPLRRALVGHLPLDAVADAVAEALVYAWQNWEQVRDLANPGGYLFRVAQTRSRRRLEGVLPGPDAGRLPHVEPQLGAAMRALPVQQRSAVWLIHACGWTYAETAEALGITPSAVGTHVARGMAGLRHRLGVGSDA